MEHDWTSAGSRANPCEEPLVCRRCGKRDVRPDHDFGPWVDQTAEDFDSRWSVTCSWRDEWRERTCRRSGCGFVERTEATRTMLS
jgi:hypothetical protein